MAGSFGDYLEQAGISVERKGKTMTKCVECGKEFEPRDPRFKMCPDCYRRGGAGGGGGARGQTAGGQGQQGGASGGGGASSLLLPAYYGDQGTLLREVYIDTPRRVAQSLQAMDMKTASVRRFYTQVRRIWDDLARGTIPFPEAQSRLARLVPLVEYRVTRKVVPAAFAEFIRHHEKLARQSPENMRGFKEHFEAVVCYLKGDRERR